MNEVGKKNIFNNREIWIKKDFFYYFISFFFLQKRFKDSCFSYYTCYIYINIDIKNSFLWLCLCKNIFIDFFPSLVLSTTLKKGKFSFVKKKQKIIQHEKHGKMKNIQRNRIFRRENLKKNFFDKEKNRLNKRI